LPPIKQSRELNPLDATLDSEPQKQAVEMRFDGSLGNIQIASDFRVVTSLKKKIYDLPFPGTHWVQLFFHKGCTWPMRPRSLQVAKAIRNRRHIRFGSLRLILHSRGQIGP